MAINNDKNTKTKLTSESNATKASSSGSAKKQSNAKSGSEIAEGSMLEEFIMDSVKDIYWAEKHLLKALPKLKKAATTDELKQAFQDHLEVTQEHVTRLESVFEIMGKKAQAKKCEAMEGLTKEADSIIEETEKGTMTRDVALICAAQKVEHYEIATYGSLVQLATTLGLTEVAELFQQTLNEERETDQSLTDIAENKINWEAAERDDDLEDEELEEEDSQRKQKPDDIPAGVVKVIAGRGYSENFLTDNLLLGNIYLDTTDLAKATNVYTEFVELLNAFSIEIEEEQAFKRGSWLKSFTAKFVAFLNKKETEERLKKIEEALEMKYIGNPQADIDLKKAEACEKVLNSLKDIQNAAIRIGTLVIIKLTNSQGANVIIMTISQDECKTLDNNPQLLQNPKSLLKKLKTAQISG